MRKGVWFAGIAAACITFAVYLPALQNGFVNWDDHLYVYENLNIQSIGIESLKWAFTAVVSSNWHPLTLFSNMLDYAVWGLDPYGYHLTNVIFHILNTLLIFILTVKLIERSKKKMPGSSVLIAGLTTALLFGIHPLHVESVAWISERKDVLCAFFFLLTLLAYLKYTSSIFLKKHIWYVICLVFFTLALMSKPMAVTLPVVLMLLDFYPLRRNGGNGEREKRRKGERENGKTDFPLSPFLLEKLPFFVLSILSSVITLWAQGTGGALKTLERYPFTDRLLVSMRAFIFYLFKMILPFRLAPLYPHPKEIHFFHPEYIASFILLLIITIFSIRSLKKNRLFSVVWFYYIITLLPVIGIVKVGEAAAADRYTYLPGLGPFLLAGVGAGYLFTGYSKKRYAGIGITVIMCLLTIKTMKQIHIWKDSITLWSYEIDLFPDTAEMAYNNRGNAYDSAGKYQQAISDFNRAVAINPEHANAYNNRGMAYNSLGRYQRAIADFNRAILLNNTLTEAYNNRGIAYIHTSSFQRAIADFNRAIDRDPGFVKAYNNRGIAHARSGNFQQAKADFTTAITLNPAFQGAYNNLRQLYSQYR